MPMRTAVPSSTNRTRHMILAAAMAAVIAIFPRLAPSAAAQATASTYSVLFAFDDSADGGYPAASPVTDNSGNLYSTSTDGGLPSLTCPFGCGVVYELAPDGTESVLYTFTGGPDGLGPLAGLVRDSAGNLYGTTPYGGYTGGICGYQAGCGVVFKLDPAGNETVLHTFTGPDGNTPVAGLVLDATGNLYGTTLFGGPNSSRCADGSMGCGVVFRVD